MRWSLLLGLSLLGACTQKYDAQAPQVTIESDTQTTQTIVSTNPCIDAILVELVGPERILSVSHYSQAPGSSSMDVTIARRFAANGGTAEEIISYRPDVVLLGVHTPKATLDVLHKADLKIELISVPNSIAESLEQIDQIAAAVGAESRGDDLKARINAAVSQNSKQPKNKPALLIWQAGGLVPGVGTLIDDMIEKAGFQNASGKYNLAMWDILPLEPVASDPPQIILSPVNAKSGESRNIYLRERFLSRFSGQILKAGIPENLLHCGGPTIIKAMKLLGQVRADLKDRES